MCSSEVTTNCATNLGVECFNSNLALQIFLKDLHASAEAFCDEEVFYFFLDLLAEGCITDY